MKHLPSELLYLLKVYNYITYDIGLDRARSCADKIRKYIADADYLKDHPGIYEYLSEEKSIDDIITYVLRNEKTYSLLSQWKEGEAVSLFSAKGDCCYLDSLRTGGFTFCVCENKRDLSLTVKTGLFADREIIFTNALPCESFTVEAPLLWYEFYRSKDSYFFEMFTDSLCIHKIEFTDFQLNKVFLGVGELTDSEAHPLENALTASALILEKQNYDPFILSDREKDVLPLAEAVFALHPDCERAPSEESLSLFAKLLQKHDIKSGLRLIGALKKADNIKEQRRISKRLHRRLLSKKSLPFAKELCAALTFTTKSES